MLLANPSPCSRCPLFFPFPLTWLLTWLPPSLPPFLPSSIALPPSLPLPPLHPLATQGSHQPLLSLLSLSLSVSSVCLSFSLFSSVASLHLSLSALCSEAAAPRAGRLRYDREWPQIHAQAHSDTPTPTFLVSLSLSGFSNNLGCFSASNLKPSDPAPHNYGIKPFFPKNAGLHRQPK